jgi:hypothetical protein
MRTVCSAFVLTASLMLAQQPPVHRALTTEDAVGLNEAVSVGHRVLVALRQYSDDMPAADRIEVDRALITRTPTVEILHAYRYVTDSDFAACRRYHATLHPVPSEAPATQPLLSMQTDRGILVFQISGEVALEPLE